MWDMDKSFTSCLLVQQSSNQYELIQTAVNLQPGLEFSLPQGKSAVLAGGFPTLTPESNVPLSSAFLLNSGLASLSDEHLEKIAAAELMRIRASQFRTFTLEPDNRVAVLSDDGDKLHGFIESYGGVLEIEPLLLKGSHPDLPSVTELGMARVENGCRIEYEVRSPIDLSRCTYCGDCGPSCPEFCLDENLAIDFSSCTLCRKCEEACSVDAIDVHGVEHRSITVPAVILLGEITLEMEEGENLLFSESELPNYFGTLFPVRIDETVTWNSSSCQYNSGLGVGCNLCARACQHNAIIRDGNGIKIDASNCQECGGCFGVCPTGAMQYGKFTDSTFLHYLTMMPELNGSRVVIGDDASFHKLWWHGRKQQYDKTIFLPFDQVQGLSLMHLLALVEAGVQQVVLLNEQLAEGLADHMKMMNGLMREMFGHEGFVVSISARTLALEGLTGAAQLPELSKNEAHKESDSPSRRQVIASALQHLTSVADRNLTIEGRVGTPFATITCDSDGCTLCGACLNGCKVASLSGNEQELKLMKVGALCVGCGVCVAMCPERVLTMSNTATLDEDFFAPVELAKGEPMNCTKCGKAYGTKKSYERVMALLANKEKVDTSHFAYCEDCRVKILFEEQ